MWLFQLFVPAIEILIIAILLYYLLSFFWNTRAMDLLYGSLAFLAFYALSKWFNLPVLEKLMLYVVNVAVLALLIIFQPELRLALSRLSLKSKKYREITEFDKFLESIAQSVYRLSERRIGALVVLENQDSLEDLAHKAVMLDIGGESTRPQATPVSEKEELERVLPVLKELKKQISIPISIDTMKPRVAEAAIDAGAALINDVSGFRNPEMRELAASCQLPICVMHMHETPQTMQNNPAYPYEIIDYLLDWFKERIDLLLNAGVKEKQIILDPGIGFGKTVADNIEILHNVHKIKALGFPVLLGLSRKSFLGKIINKTYPDLLAASLAVNTIAVLSHVDIIRVHDVRENRDVIDIVSFMNPIKGKA